jgi:hypothetical protein
MKSRAGILRAVFLMLTVGVGTWCVPAVLYGQSVTGTVRDSVSGAPVAGATVTLAKFTTSGRWDWMWIDVATTTTSASGEYSFTGIDPTVDWERYRVTVEKSGYDTKTSNGVAVEGDTTGVIDVALVSISAVRFGRHELMPPRGGEAVGQWYRLNGRVAGAIFDAERRRDRLGVLAAGALAARPGAAEGVARLTVNP